MSDAAAASLRERLWIVKVDHETDPPTVVEEVFIENGVIMERRDPRKASSERQEVDATDDATVAAVDLAPTIVVSPEPSEQEEQADAERRARAARERARWE